jgi:hypothetical protein
MKQHGYTTLTDLAELELLEDSAQQHHGGGPGTSSAIRPNTDKYIQNSYEVPIEAGMYQAAPQHQGPPPPMNMDHGSDEIQQHPQQPQTLADKVDAGHSPSCLRISDHIMECRMCSRFYNPDKTIYIIVIVVLSIVCILLLKRVLDI